MSSRHGDLIRPIRIWEINFRKFRSVCIVKMFNSTPQILDPSLLKWMILNFTINRIFTRKSLESIVRCESKKKYWNHKKGRENMFLIFQSLLLCLQINLIIFQHSSSKGNIWDEIISCFFCVASRRSIILIFNFSHLLCLLFTDKDDEKSPRS